MADQEQPTMRYIIVEENRAQGGRRRVAWGTQLAFEAGDKVLLKDFQKMEGWKPSESEHVIYYLLEEPASGNSYTLGHAKALKSDFLGRLKLEGFREDDAHQLDGYAINNPYVEDIERQNAANPAPVFSAPPEQKPGEVVTPPAPPEEPKPQPAAAPRLNEDVPLQIEAGNQVITITIQIAPAHPHHHGQGGCNCGKNQAPQPNAVRAEQARQRLQQAKQDSGLAE